MSYVFICIDRNSARNEIILELLKMNVSFLDVGLGVQLVDDKLIGIIRTTVGTPENKDHLQKRIPVVDSDINEYATNIQIADLNLLNAGLAVVKWKKLCGFYEDLIGEHHSTYSINVAELINGDTSL